jgi:hypothetical protein
MDNSAAAVRSVPIKDELKDERFISLVTIDSLGRRSLELRLLPYGPQQ